MKIIAVILGILIIAGAILTFLGGNAVKAKLSPQPVFSLHNTGTEKIVQYDKYGEFVKKGTSEYHYVIKDRAGLVRAVGEGIYPGSLVFKDPVYKKLVKEKKLTGTHWNYIDTEDPKIAFYKWATAGEDPGVKQFYTALALENAGLITQAIKAYYAVLVHFPKTVSFTYWNTPWYPSKVAINKIKYLTGRYPVLGMKLVDAEIFIENGYNLDPADDKYIMNPGQILACRASGLIEEQDTKRLAVITKQIGYGDINLLSYKSGDWQLMVEGRPFMIKAVAYTPTKVGQSPDEGTLDDWMKADYDANGKIDGPYDAWIDKNFSNLKEENEAAIGDFQLMKDMGVNTVRIYDHKLNSNKKLLRDLYDKFGIRVIMGDLLGAYAIGSGASWYRGTNYADHIHRERLKKRVREMVEAYKDEPYILIWMLGNENNYGVANSAKRFPEPYYKFVNEVAKMIKEIDPNHPVAVCNGDTLYIDIFSKLCPDVDIFGANSYRGWQGFGFWDEVKRLCGKPVIITEYGAPSYWNGHTKEEAETAQSEYHIGCWNDMLYNSAGYGYGNALGGVIFEWVDEWWKDYEPLLHDTHTQWPGPVKGGWIYEEWLGIISQGDGSDSPYLRQLREAYYTYKSLWNPTVIDRLKDLWYRIVITLI